MTTPELRVTIARLTELRTAFVEWADCELLDPCPLDLKPEIIADPGLDVTLGQLREMLDALPALLEAAEKGLEDERIVCGGCGKGRDRHTNGGLCMDVEYAGGQRWIDAARQEGRK